MTEEYFTNKKLKPALKQAGFYYEKFADNSTIGKADSFIAKNGKGMFVEIKIIQTSTIPNQFKRWSLIQGGSKTVQFATMLLRAQHFPSLYIIVFEIEEINDILIFYVKPFILLKAIQEKTPIDIDTLYKLENFITVLNQFLS